MQKFDDRHAAEAYAVEEARQSGYTCGVGELLNEDGDAMYLAGYYLTVEEWALTRDAGIIYTAQPGPLEGAA